MLLLQYEKAGSWDLQNFYKEKINSIKTKRKEIKERIKIKTAFSSEEQMKYYSTWYLSAIHILIALPAFNSLESISEKAGLDINVVKEAIDFLEKSGFIVAEGSWYTLSDKRIHLPKGSLMLPRHHSNWRMRAISSVDYEKDDDLHYSSILGISRRDMKVFKEKLLGLLEEFEPIIENSKEEIPVILLLDLFEL